MTRRLTSIFAVGGVGFEQARHAILEEDGLVGQPHQMVVDVAESVRSSSGICGNSRRARRPRRRAAGSVTRRSDRDVRLELEDVLQRVPLRLSRRPLLERLEPILEPVHLRPVVIDQRSTSRCSRLHGPSPSTCAWRAQHRPLRVDRPGRLLVHRDEVVASEEEVDVVGGDPLLRLAGDDPVEDQVQQSVVGFDLRMMHFVERILDGEFVEVKRLEQQPPLGLFRIERDRPRRSPSPPARATRDRPLGRPGHAVAIDEDRDHEEIMSGQRAKGRGQREGERKPLPSALSRAPLSSASPAPPRGARSARGTASSSRSRVRLRRRTIDDGSPPCSPQTPILRSGRVARPFAAPSRRAGRRRSVSSEANGSSLEDLLLAGRPRRNLPKSSREKP